MLIKIVIGLLVLGAFSLATILFDAKVRTESAKMLFMILSILIVSWILYVLISRGGLTCPI